MDKRGVLILTVASLAYSGSIIFTKLALNSGFDVLQFSLMMISFALLFSVPFLWKGRSNFKRMTKGEWLYVGLIGVIASGIVQFLFVYGQKYTQATNVGFLSTLSAPFTALLAVFMIHERLSLKKWMLMGIGFIGIAILASNLSLGVMNKGDLTIALAMVLVAFTNVIAKIAMKNLSGVFVNALRCVFGFLFVLLFLGKRAYHIPGISTTLWLYLVASAVFMYLFLALFYWGIQLTSPTTATVVGLSMVVFTSIFAFIFLGESLSWVQWLGGIIGTIGIAMFAVLG